MPWEFELGLGLPEPPNLSNLRIKPKHPCWKWILLSGLDNFQTGLDIVGLVPGGGETADLINAAISALRGNYADAGLSLAAMVPIIGWGATGKKLAGNYLDKITPQKAKDVLDYIKKHNGAPPKNHKGGKKFENDGRQGGEKLPETDLNGNDIEYKEYDVNPKKSGEKRDSERIIIGSDGSSYYTNDHYDTFIPMSW